MEVFAHIFAYISLTEHVISLQNSNEWKQKLDLHGYITSGGSNVTARDVVHCGIKCQSMSGCLSFFITIGQSSSNCVLNSQVYSSSTGMIVSPNSRYYEQTSVSEPMSMPASMATSEPVSAAMTPSVLPVNPLTMPLPTFQCHANDGEFRTFQLQDSTEFTYVAITMELDYNGAESFCNSLSSTLVHITSNAKLSMLRDLLSCPDFAHLGYYFVNGMYNEASGEWYFTNGSLATFQDSFWGELPFNPSVFMCCALSSDSGWYLLNERCDFIEAFICEM